MDNSMWTLLRTPACWTSQYRMIGINMEVVPTLLLQLPLLFWGSFWIDVGTLMQYLLPMSHKCIWKVTGKGLHQIVATKFEAQNDLEQQSKLYSIATSRTKGSSPKPWKTASKKQEQREVPPEMFCWLWCEKRFSGLHHQTWPKTLDLNTIKCMYSYHPTSVPNIHNVLVDEWEQIPKDTQNLVDCSFKRATATTQGQFHINACGFWMGTILASKQI